MEFTYDVDKVMKLVRAIPRFTSYPTAVEWDKISSTDYSVHLKKLDAENSDVSLYIHIPFCKTMCLYCACPVVLNRRKENEDLYVENLKKEIQLVRSHFTQPLKIKQLHFGGGTPTKLSEKHLRSILSTLEECCDFSNSEERAIEIDPRTVVEDEGAKLKLLRSLGFDRVSFGVQDTSQEVQEVVKRRQTMEMTTKTFHWSKDLGFKSINIDLIYGLPKQNLESFSKTIDDILDLRPDRIALFSFAYVPWIATHQKALKEDTLPSTQEKFEIYLQARKQLTQAGYLAIGMDHFALEDDGLAVNYKNKTLKRNFMGYTTCPTQDLIGCGHFAIGYVQGGYFQNAKTLPEYYSSLDQGNLPTKAGKILSEDDLIRRWVIEQLMCNFEIDKQLFEELFLISFDDYFSEESLLIEELEKDDLIIHSSSKIEATEYGHLFIRNIAVAFDYYFQKKSEETTKKFSLSV
jgi:oxygen-independent coproporphyrinogen III oxidase